MLLLLLAGAMLLSLSGCNIFARYETPAPDETPEAPAPEPEPEPEPETVVIDSPIVGTWHNTYTADGTTSTMEFRADGTGCETGQADAPEGSRVDFTYTVREDYLEITVETTTLAYTFTLEDGELALTYQGHDVAD